MAKRSYPAVQCTFKSGRTTILPRKNLDNVMTQFKKTHKDLIAVHTGIATVYDEEGVTKESFEPSEPIWQNAEHAAISTTSKTLETLRNVSRERDSLAQQNDDLLKQLEEFKAREAERVAAAEAKKAAEEKKAADKAAAEAKKAASK